MEIEKQPSPWPAVLMLVGLLACCLAAPCYWQHEQSKPQPPQVTVATQPREFTAFSFRVMYAPSDRAVAIQREGSPESPNDELLRLWTPPSIDELVAARATYGRFDPLVLQRERQFVPWSPYTSINPAIEIDGSQVNPLNSTATPMDVPPTTTSADRPPTVTIEAPAIVTDSLFALGEMYADYAPNNLWPRLMIRFMDSVPGDVLTNDQVSQIIESGDAARSSLQLLTQDERLAAVPQPHVVPWCVPQTLYEQLYRLAGDAHTATWASQVANQLHALADREQLAGDDVQQLLADLSDASQQAIQLADSASDDRLRVEILRTYWALARRLDCWTAVHDEHVAFRVQDRVAARGDLRPYFEGEPNQSTTPADVVALSRDLETYEATNDPRLAARIVEQQRTLAASPAAFDRALANAVEQHYRNANVRIAISAELINRMVSAEHAESRPVRDRIAGAFVRGQSDVVSRSRIELAPAENEWQLKVRTNGVVESNTLANSGPVRLRSRGATDFAGTKAIAVRPDGVHLQPSDVDARSQNRLLGVTTDYDWMPIIGSYARDRALQEYRARRNRVRTEMELRVSSEASDTLDRETHEAMERARQNFYNGVAQRTERYGIKLNTVEMKSTPERLIARVRVAGDDQLGSNTPRPRALSDSLASVQVHESAITNLAVTLGLDGQRLTGAELRQKIQEQFPKLVITNTADTNRDTVFQFAAKNAVRVHVKDGRLELVLMLDSVELDDEAMPNVIVHAQFKPAIDGMRAQLARDGALGIEGRFSAGERARLHNIFQAVLPPDHTLQLVQLNSNDGDHAKVFDGLMITQLVLEDGWMGLAIGPQGSQRVAERSRSLR